MKKSLIKKGCLFILLSALVLETHAQSKGLVAQADRKYENLMFKDAVSIYEKAISKKSSDDISKKIALCYVKLNEPQKVVAAYTQVKSLNEMSPEHHYNYAQALSSIGKFDDAKQWYTLYEKEASKDLRGHNKVYALEHLEEYYKDSSKYDVAQLEVLNSSFSDFAPTFYKEGIVFPSGRKVSKGSKRTFKWDNSAFLDLYYSEKIGESPTDYDEPKHFSNTLNTKYHEGACTFNEAGNQVVFTRNNYLHANRKNSTDGSTLLKLYYAEHLEAKDGVHGWQKIVELPFNSDEYSVGDPSANADFTVLYFVSNMPGGYGATDIYKSEFKDNKWSEPVNLGPEINTLGNERMPYIHKDGTLFFASDGRDGLGGLDIYEAKADAKKWNVHNLGYPLNSPMDDFGLIMSEDKTYGYFSSNRYGGVGSDDIYKVLMKNIRINIAGNTYVKQDGKADDTKQKLQGSSVFVYDKTHKKYVDTLASDDLAKFNIELVKGAEYEFKAEKGDLNPALASLDLRQFDDRTETTLDLILIEPLPNTIRMLVEVKDKDTKEAIKNSTVYFMDEKTKEVKSYITDDAGRVIISVLPETNYVMKGTKVKYLSDCITFNSGKATKESKAPERPLYLELFKVAQKFKIENVYFDLNKDNIREDAAIELDKVVAFILEHPGITVELGSHTDARGSDAYNLSLSERRAKSSRTYIVSKGVAEDAITFKGYGETEITNKCLNDIKCTEKEHEANRRTEIKITGIKDMSPEEEAVLEKNKQGLSPNESVTDCEQVLLK